VWFLGPFVIHGFHFPLGPDAPVYLWWTRLAGHEGLSAVGHRPGVPALALVLDGTLHIPLVATLAGLECVLAVAIGLGSAALVRGMGRDRATWLLGGVLAGTFAVHLAAGYLANLAFAALFIAVAVMLGRTERRATFAAAVLLGASGLAHPLFFLLGAGILLISAALAWRVDRAETARVAAATVGGGAVLGAGLLLLLIGPGPLNVDTSRDGFLRRAGLGDALRSIYLDRFVHRWTRYVQWASIPLAIGGLRDATRFEGRFLRAWGITLVAGVGLALATRIAPADRFITFGYVVPILAALGLVRLWQTLGARRALALAMTSALTVAMLAGALIAWARQEPFLSELEVSRVAAAARYAAGTAPGTALVFLANDVAPSITFLATRAANVIRAGMPAERIRSVVLRVPWPEAPAPTERWKLAHLTRDDVRAAERAGDGRSDTFVLAPFDRLDVPSGADLPGLVSEGVFVTSPSIQPRPVADPLEPSSPAEIAFAALVVFAALGSAGYGWARAASGEPWRALALAPAFGAAAIVVLGVALERAGLALSGAMGPTIVSVIAGGGGYVAWFVLERCAAPDTTHQVDRQPHE
jgi:hypothetical protein